jgi:uncharacterized protein YqgV (UPF0045/DUF77 family)
MVIAAQVAVYPLRQERLTPAIEAFGQALRESGLTVTVGSMSTVITGEADRVFDGLHAGFLRAAAAGHVVMTVTVSNACPV